jgi:hypothetical protein
MGAPMDAALRTRDMIPPLTARTADGAIVRAWDYKQKRNLVIAFLHANCACCDAWLAQLGATVADLTEREAVVLIIYAEIPPRAAQVLPAPLIAASDVTGHSQGAFLGPDAFSSAGLGRVGVFVTDRYGELRDQWITRDGEGLPAPSEILSSLWQIQIIC